jgi:two-component system NtrC family sensor kinase
MFQEYKGLQDEIGKGNGNEVVSFKLNEIEKIEEQMELENLFEEFEALIKESKEGAERVKNIILNLKEFSHPSKGEPEWADINHGVESTLNIVWNELKYIANVKRDYGDLPQIKCYPQELNQVFMNLLVNAAQAMQERGEINISTWCEDDHVAVQIKDTGMGMTKVQMGKIFDPFYTTKEVGKGTGLGLSISYRIVKKHNGEIKVESEPGKGTTFTVLLPIKGVEPEDKNHPKDIAQA